MSKKFLGAVAGIIMVAGGCWIAGSYYAGNIFQSQLKTFTDEIGKDSGMDVSNVKQARGLFSSKGSFKLGFKDAAADQSFRPFLETEVSYEASHMITPDALTKVHWQILPVGESGKVITDLFGDAAQVTGEGRIKFNQEYVSSVHVPKLVARQDDASIDVTPTTGHFTWGKSNAALDLKTDRAIIRSDGEAFEAQQVVFETSLSDRIKGIGTAKLSVEKLASKDGIAEGLLMTAGSTLNQDRIDVRVSKSLRSLAYQGMLARDLAIEVVLNKVDAASVETLSKLINDTGMANLTAIEQAQAKTATRTMLLKGFELGIPKLTGTVGKGSIEGSLRMDLLPTPGAQASQFSLTDLLTSSGQVVLKGPVLDPQYTGMALMFGAVVQTPEGLKASYTLKNGQLKANGQALDIKKEWAAIEQAMRTWITEQ